MANASQKINTLEMANNVSKVKYAPQDLAELKRHLTPEAWKSRYLAQDSQLGEAALKSQILEACPSL